jgi:hypothetical protein
LHDIVWNLGSKRVFHFKYGALDVIRISHRGLPQGNVLIPIMYNMYTAQLGDNMPQGCRIIEFADDICQFSLLALLEAAIRVRGEGANKVDETLQTLGLEITPQKIIHGL